MIALLIVLLLGAPAASSELLPASDGGLKLGAPAPWFAGWTADDRVFNRTHLLDHKDARAHVLVFFATWCGPCEAGLRRIAAARTRLEAAGLNVVLVDYGEAAAVGAPWLAARELAWAPTLYDRYGAVAFAFGVELRAKDGARKSRLPRTFVLGPAGAVRRIVGREGSDYVDRLLDALPRPSLAPTVESEGASPTADSKTISPVPTPH